MPSQLKLQLSGLHTTQNKFSSVPPGSLDVADNIVIQYPSVGQSRNGFEKILTSPGEVKSLTKFEGVLHAIINNTLFRENGSSLTSYSGVAEPPNGVRARFLNSNEALYFNTKEGVKKIFTTGGAIRLAGVPRALDGVASAALNKTFLAGDVNTTDDRVNIDNHMLSTGVKVQVSNPGTLPTGITATTDYWVGKFDDNNISFYPTLADAQANTNKVGISAAGTGTNTLEIQASPYLGAGKSVAYRVLYGYQDSNGYLFKGSPSGRVEIKNTGAVETSATIKFRIPSEIKDGDFAQIYRSVGFTGSPNDELFLVNEIPLTSTMILAGEFFFWDTVPEASLSESLYTNATQQGILAGNDEPPVCKDMAFYKGYHLYSNTKRKEQLFTQLVSVPTVNQTITIGSEVYTAKSVENSRSKHFKIFSGGTDAENIRDTATSLIQVINKSSTLFYASYFSIGDPEGILLIYSRSYSTAQFALTTTSTSLNPIPPVGGLLSENEARPNRVCISKSSQPDAVPTSQYIEVGRSDTSIERIVALRDSIFVFKTEGIFRIVGDSYESMRVSVFDLSQQIIAPESAQVIDNSIFLVTSSSIIAVSDNGITPVGMPIEDSVLQSSKNVNFSPLTFGIGDEVEKRFFLFYPTTSGQAQADIGMVYCLRTNAWTRWTTPRSCGYADSRLWFGGGDTYGNFIYKERKNYNLTDFYDDYFEADILAIDFSTNTMTFDSAEIATLTLGMEFTQKTASAQAEIKQTTTDITVKFFDDSFMINRDFLDLDINPSLNTITILAHGYSTGEPYKFKTTGILPTPLVVGTEYYVIVLDSDTIQLAVDAADALNGIFLPVVDDGTGLHTLRSGLCTVTQPIKVKVAWNPIDGGNPGEVKHFQDCSYIFGNSTFSRAVAFFKTGFSKQNERVSLESDEGSPFWGLFPWGELPWGDGSTEEQILRTYIPLEKRRATWIYVGIEVEQSRSDVQINGVNLVMEQTTENFR